MKEEERTEGPGPVEGEEGEKGKTSCSRDGIKRKGVDNGTTGRGNEVGKFKRDGDTKSRKNVRTMALALFVQSFRRPVVAWFDRCLL